MTMPPLPLEFAMIPLIFAGITSWIDDKDMERFIGPWGGLVISLLLCAVLLRHSAKRIRREDDRAKEDAAERKLMHQENLAAMEKTHSKFEAIIGRQMDCQLETAKAILKLSDSNNNLHSEMRSRACLIKNQ